MALRREQGERTGGAAHGVHQPVVRKPHVDRAVPGPAREVPEDTAQGGHAS